MYDIAIIGGGLSGLSFSILMAKKGYKVIVFEKESYPMHRVCGEYISLESLNFLNQLGLNISEMELPIIKRVGISSPDGSFINQRLPLGGIGISRYILDEKLAFIARKSGVSVFENTSVNDVHFENNQFFLQTNELNYSAKVCIGSFGKRSNLDIKFNREFVKISKQNKLNYIGVKYHIKTKIANDIIELHNFKDGYCGISRVENGITCLCYLTTAENLRLHGSIENLEKNELFKNPYLKEYFTNSEFLFSKPVTISQIDFSNKNLIENHILMCGDSAGLIAPLCGNGMSMAFHSAYLLANEVDNYFKNNKNRNELEKNYLKIWNKNFKNRLRVGRILQETFGKVHLTNVIIKTLKNFPSIVNFLIKLTHGKSFS
ncbi:MAG: NAD(P)/FAD-dependent oxidoreductase [Cytophagales bacterium]|nr:MAG: NAD(P)/FAD-dependent oxidoreductase [Cytophagales bacterium]